jgi:hypothetical protein
VSSIGMPRKYPRSSGSRVIRRNEDVPLFRALSAEPRNADFGFSILDFRLPATCPSPLSAFRFARALRRAPSGSLRLAISFHSVPVFLISWLPDSNASTLQRFNALTLQPFPALVSCLPDSSLPPDRRQWEGHPTRHPHARAQRRPHRLHAPRRPRRLQGRQVPPTANRCDLLDDPPRPRANEEVEGAGVIRWVGVIRLFSKKGRCGGLASSTNACTSIHWRRT